MSVTDDVVVLFTRVPVPRKAKTRLAPPLTPEQCAEVQCALTADTLRALSGLSHDVLVFHTRDHEGRPDAEERFGAFRALLESSWQGAAGALRFLPQAGTGLGPRMDAAFRGAFALGAKRCLLVGADVADVRPGELEEAFGALSGDGVVLGPTLDGGYWAVGLASPFPELFTSEIYGTDGVFAEALRICARHARPVSTVACKRDVDTIDDLHALGKRVDVRPADFPCLATLLGKLRLI